MAKKKYYAVRKGLETGIFETWAECERMVKGYPRAEYKSFSTLEEAELYVQNKSLGEAMTKTIEELNDNEMIAYVDGSFDIRVKFYSYGAIFFSKDGKKEYSGRGNTEEMLEMRNVAGEIEASKLAMKVALEKNIDVLYLHYDYAGIEKWCTGEWKTNKPATQEYKKYYDSIKDRLHIEFIKIKSHSGNLYNDEVDILAKKALVGDK